MFWADEQVDCSIELGVAAHISNFNWHFHSPKKESTALLPCLLQVLGPGRVDNHVPADTLFAAEILDHTAQLWILPFLLLVIDFKEVSD